MKRITLVVADDVHAILVEKARSDDRPLVKFLSRLLLREAGKSKPIPSTKEAETRK